MTEDETHRLFVALPVPRPVRVAICDAQNQLRSAIRPGAIRWTPDTQFHLTLKFLGDFPAWRVEELNRALAVACGKFAPLEMTAERVGCFPNVKRPRVLWVGVHDTKNRLPALQRALETALREFTAERPDTHFVGHVTLGRVKELPRHEAASLAAGIAAMEGRRFGGWRGDNVELMRSKLSSAGAEHRLVAAFPLSGNT